MSVFRAYSSMNFITCMYLCGFPKWCSGKESTCQCRRHKRCRVYLWTGKSPWSRKWQPTPVFLPGESLGQKSLVGCSPWCCKELDTTEHKIALYVQILKWGLNQTSEIKLVNLDFGELQTLVFKFCVL